MSYFDRDEYLADCSIRTMMTRAKIQKEAESKIWTTKDGRKLSITEMSTSHIQNTIKYLERNNSMDILTAWIIVFQDELANRSKNLVTN